LGTRPEIINLIKRRKYFRTFIRNLKDSDETYIAVYDKQDIKPFLKDCMNIASGVVGKFVRVMRLSLSHKLQLASSNYRVWRINYVSDHTDDPENFL